ncbi:MAG: ATP-binding protein [Ottowia sp.]|uniref:ATP-binding protein n=1 Tax=unclassified Ottowia TaxID=2645081 RepID=UPI003C2CAEF1
MRRLKLQSKAFIALAALLAALLVLFVGFSRLGLQRGLGPYMAEVELAGMDWLADRLTLYHGQQGGWEFLRGQHGPWHDLLPPGGEPRNRLHSSPPDQPPAPPSGHDEPPRRGPPEGRPPLAPPDRPFGGPFERLGLMDAQGHLVYGLAPQPGAARRTLRSTDGQAVGELVLSPAQNLQSETDRAFLAQQMGFVAWTGLAGLGLALLLSAWLARRWLEPLTAFVEGLRGIAAGKLETRVMIKGDQELDRLADTFNDMATQLAGVEASRQRWLADVAHELRTPLTTMRAEMEAIQDGVHPLDERTALRLHRQTMRLIRLVDDLRVSLDGPDASRSANHVPVHPLSLLIEALQSVAPRFAQANINLAYAGVNELAARDPAPLVSGDAHQLHQLFSNVLENTLRYTEAPGRLEVAAVLDTWQGGAALQLIWDDTAPGVAPQHLPRLFDRLYRVDASRVREGDGMGGSGLGLAICSAIAQAHGGRIEASVSPLGGLRITLWLPLLENSPP